MSRHTVLILLLATVAAPQIQAAPALGPSFSAGPNPTYRRPVQPQLQQRNRAPLFAVPKSKTQLGTRGAINSETPVCRHRGSAGSMNLTHDLQLRPAL